MDYKKIYDQFIADRRLKEAALLASGEYFERHHVIPKSMGGNDSKGNLICLTPEDHVHAHILLAKTYGGIHWVSVMFIVTGNHSLRIPTKRMIKNNAIAKRKYSEFLSTPEQNQIRSERVLGEKNPAKRPEVRAKMSASQIGKVRPMDQRIKQSESTKGVKKSAAHRAALKGCQSGEKHAMYGVNHKEESKAKTSNSLKAQGRAWCTNGIENKIIKTNLGETAPNGWHLGRTKNFKTGAAPKDVIQKNSREIFKLKKDYAIANGLALNGHSIQRNIKIAEARLWAAAKQTRQY